MKTQGYVAGSGAYGDNLMRQDGTTNFPLFSTQPLDASFANGETYDLNKSTTLDFSSLNSQDSVMLNGTDTGEIQDMNATEGAAFYRVELQ